jgi:hypothetical protein
MVNWVHHGPVAEKRTRWMTTAEFVDGKAYLYYDFPNDADPHWVRRSTRWLMIFPALNSWRRSRIGREDCILGIAKPARVIKPGIADKRRQHHVADMRIVALI